MAIVPDEKEMERRQKAAQDEMLSAIHARAGELMQHHLNIAMGEATDPDGKPPDFMTQHLAAASIEKHVLGSPKQTIEQHSTSKSISFKATYEIPAVPVDPSEQPERIEKPATKLVAPKPMDIPAILASAPTASEELARWKSSTIDAALAMPLDGYGTELPKEEK